MSMNSDNKKVRYKMDCYILHLILVVIILLFIIAFICYHYEKYRSKQRHIGAPTVKKVSMKNCTYYYFDDITKTEDFDFGNILLVKKPFIAI